MGKGGWPIAFYTLTSIPTVVIYMPSNATYKSLWVISPKSRQQLLFD
jgi:hypothetical protein